MDEPLGALIDQGRTAEIYAWGQDQVVKLFRPEWSEGAADYEASVAAIVARQVRGAPAYGGMVTLSGRKGILYERISGESMLTAMSRRPWTLFGLARQFADLHLSMHAASAPELPSRREKLARAINRAPRLSQAAKGSLLTQLEALPDGLSVTHGDFHPGNVLLAPQRPVAIDWMDAAHGSPVCDVARTVLLFRHAVLPSFISPTQQATIRMGRQLFLAAYLRRYRRSRPAPEAEIAAWTPVLAGARLIENIPEEEDLLLRLAGEQG